MEDHLQQQGNEITQQKNEITQQRNEMKQLKNVMVNIMENNRNKEAKFSFKPYTELSSNGSNVQRWENISRDFFFNGYKLRLGIYSSYIYRDIFYEINKGPFDEYLKWPMPYDSIQISYSVEDKETKLNLNDFDVSEGVKGYPDSRHSFTIYVIDDVEKLELAMKITS